MGIFCPPILKLFRERSVCAPQYLSAGTFTSPIVSCSIRYRCSARATSSRCTSSTGGTRTMRGSEQRLEEALADADRPYVVQAERLYTRDDLMQGWHPGSDHSVTLDGRIYRYDADAGTMALEFTHPSGSSIDALFCSPTEGVWAVGNSGLSPVIEPAVITK